MFLIVLKSLLNREEDNKKLNEEEDQNETKEIDKENSTFSKITNMKEGGRSKNY